MDENKNEILEEGTESPVEETVEEAVVETEEVVAEEVAEEATEEAVDGEEEVEDSTEAEKYVDVNLLIDKIAEIRKKNKILKGVLTAIVAVIVAIALAFGGMQIYKAVYNPYNHMGYYNISGMTIADMAEANNITVEDIIDQLRLPEDVKEDTYFDVVEFLVPVSYMAEMYGADFETLKEAFSLGEHITSKSTWGEALDSMTLLTYLGSEEVVEEFIAEYGLGEDVTSETLWGDVRKTVNKIDYERHLAEMATEVIEEVTEEVTEDVVEDATEMQ